MESYKDIPIWENSRRIRFLIEFRNLIVGYFDNIEYPEFRIVNDPIENDKSKKIRSKINIFLNESHFIILTSGINPTIYYSPPPAVGGLTGNIDLIYNIFNLHNFKIDSRDLIDPIERSIGVYEKDRINSFLRTINPFYWIILLLDFVINLPFRILGRVGFNQQKIEGSLVGKTIKGVLYLITVFATFLTILEKLGHLEWFKNLIAKFK